MRTLYFETNHADLVGGGGLALYNLARALQESFEVHLELPWNGGMALYEFLMPPKVPWKVGRPGRIDVHVASKYAEFVPPRGDANVFYCLYPRERWDMSGYQRILTLSNYSAGAIAARWARTADIVVGGAFWPAYGWDRMEKRNTFLSCARFFMESDPSALEGNSNGHSKGQHHLIRAFRQADIPGWTLVLAGSVLLPEDQEYLDCLRELADGDRRIVFEPMAKLSRLQDLYQRSKIFVHGMGHRRTDPAEVEHYGIVVEKALLSGCHTVVHASGGAPELAAETWGSVDELAEIMAAGACASFDHAAIATDASHRFTWDRFVGRVWEVFRAFA